MSESLQRLKKIKAVMRDHLKSCQLYEVLDQFDMIDIDSFVMLLRAHASTSRDLDETASIMLASVSNQLQPETMKLLHELSDDKKKFTKELIEAALSLIKIL